MLAIISQDVSLSILAFTTVVYLVLAFLILRFARSLEGKLLLLGLLTGVIAVWVGALLSMEQAVQVPGAAARVVVASDASPLLGRLAVLLVLGSLALAALRHRASPFVPTSQEVTRDATL